MPQEHAGIDGTLMDLRVSPKTMQLQTAEKLRASIVNGVFKPGERLVESRLCRLFGVSRPLLREALRSIEAEKLITIIPNAGPIVSVLTWEEAAEIYRVRSLLEGEAAGLCAERVSKEGIEAMRRALADFQRAQQSGILADQLSATQTFYDVMLKECGNRLLEEILDGLLARVNLLRVRSMSLYLRSKSSTKELRAIFKAIEAHDAEAARAAAVLHVEKASASAKIVYDQQLETVSPPVKARPISPPPAAPRKGGKASARVPSRKRRAS